MTINELKLHIIQGGLGNTFVFYGVEQKVQNVYVHKIAEVTGSEICYIDSLKEVLENKSNSLFELKKCFVCIDPVELLKSDKISDDFAKITQNLGVNCLIVQFTKMDKRSRLYNFCKEVGVEFEPLHPVVLRKHIKDEVDMLTPSMNKLIEVCEGDYGRILLELDKIKNYAAENSNLAFKELLDSGVIYEPPGDKIFDFVGAVLAGKPKLSFRLLRDCKDIGEPSLRLLTVLFTNAKHLLQVQACKGEILETTGLTSWEVRNVQDYKGVYKNYELVNLMKLIREVEIGIKTGQMDESIAVDYVLVKTF